MKHNSSHAIALILTFQHGRTHSVMNSSYKCILLSGSEDQSHGADG